MCCKSCPPQAQNLHSFWCFCTGKSQFSFTQNDWNLNISLAPTGARQPSSHLPFEHDGMEFTIKILKSVSVHYLNEKVTNWQKWDPSTTDNLLLWVDPLTYDFQPKSILNHYLHFKYTHRVYETSVGRNRSLRGPQYGGGGVGGGSGTANPSWPSELTANPSCQNAFFFNF